MRYKIKHSKMSVTVCTEGSDRAFDEVAAWPVQMLVSYLTLAYITREPLFTIVFGFLWESFEMFVLVINQKLAADNHSKFAQWAVDTGPLSWIVPPSSDAKARPCIESPLTSLFFDPIIFIGAVCLWSIGVERLAGIRYDEKRSFSHGCRRIVYYIAVSFTVLFASRVVFSRHIDQVGDVDRTDAFEPDLGLLMSTLAFIVFTFFIPLRSGQRNGFTSTEARRAFLAYIVYVLFVSFSALFGVLGGPFVGVRSSWGRAVIAIAVLFSSTLLVAAVRFGRWADAAAGEYITSVDEKNKKRDLY